MATNLCSPAGDGGAASWCRESEEGQLLASDRSGQAAAFAELCRAYTKKILGVAYRITKNHEDAEDAVQDSFLRAFLHMEHFEGRSSFSTWLTRIAINSALMILRRSAIPPKFPWRILGISGPLAGVSKSRTAVRIRKSNTWRKSASDLCEG